MFGEKMDLRLPGPVQVPKEVQRAMLQSFDHQMLDYRNPCFQEILKNTMEDSKMIFQTSKLVIPLTSSGTSALEAAIINTVGPKDTVLLCINGYFGEYLHNIVNQVGCKVIRVEVDWGKTINPDEIKKILQNRRDVKAVLITHCDTSTGAINNIQEIAAIVSETPAVLIVDAVSSIVGTPLYMDKWGIDIVATSCQKALMLPPGLALIAIGDKAWDIIERHKCPSLYFDLKKYRHSLQSSGTPFTPNIALICGLQEACKMIVKGGGMEASFKRHSSLRDITRAGVRAIGLELFVSDAVASPTITTVSLEKADDFRKMLRDSFHIALGGGLGKMKNNMLRLGHMGYTDVADILKMLATIELGLKKIGKTLKLGAGVAAAQEEWIKNPYC